MSDTIILNNYSDDSQIKKYVSQELLPRVFNDIPINVLNSGHFSLINEYMSQAIESQSFTNAFYFNESFITKAVLPDSIYAEAAIFNIGYSYATPSSCNFLLELKIEDIYKNAKKNEKNGLYEFILDKNTKFNLSNGNVYSLDYDILIQYYNKETSERTSNESVWNVQYINTDEKNVCATNKNVFIVYRVTETWLCLLINASEYVRTQYQVMNTQTNGIPNEDTVIECENHIAGFDIKYVEPDGTEQWLDRKNILAMHDTVSDGNPYVHYIMDNPQTIRFMWQMAGSRYFIPKTNSHFEITVYTCHGKSANFTAVKEEQPQVITTTNKYANNGNVLKVAFVISGSMGGTDIGTVETVRRETIEAYNTANVISSDHDIDEWFKTFFFKNVIYPYFFKRRDDPWGRVWSGYLALKDDDDFVFRTNTLHGYIPYDVLYNNNDNTISKNEVVIPPGWLWVYTKDEDKKLFEVVPYTNGDGITVEQANSKININEKFVFANPFGIRFQREPFAIGYFNPWINTYHTATKTSNFELSISNESNNNVDIDDASIIYHATPIITNVKRTYKDNFYRVRSQISPTMTGLIDGSSLVQSFKNENVKLSFSEILWTYFNYPLDEFTKRIPMIAHQEGSGYLPFDPKHTYICVKNKHQRDDGTWNLETMWIEDRSFQETKKYPIYVGGSNIQYIGTDKIWGENGLYEEIPVSGDNTINIYPLIKDEDKLLSFYRVETQNYYIMKLHDDAAEGTIDRITVSSAIKTDLTKYGESYLTKIGSSYDDVKINVFFNVDNNGIQTEKCITYTISNAANIYMPYEFDEEREENGLYVFHLNNVGASGVIMFADMKPSPESESIDHYEMLISSMNVNEPMFYVENTLLKLESNNMRVVISAKTNGVETGYCEMQPIALNNDGSYEFESIMYPLNQLVDIDNKISIASTVNGGGNWVSTTGYNVYVDATEPELYISIFIRSQDTERPSEIVGNNSFIGFRKVDEYILDDVSFIQELKEMRSVVKYGDSSSPTHEQMKLYEEMNKFSRYNEYEYNIWTINKIAYDKKHDNVSKYNDNEIKTICTSIIENMDGYRFNERIKDELKLASIPSWYTIIQSELNKIINNDLTIDFDWNNSYEIFNNYAKNVEIMFDKININDNGVEIQLMPFIDATLMTSTRFESFIASFTQVHKAIEPVIFKRLEGNHYLDCKLIATYGRPHSYSSDIDFDDDTKFWPDLNVQVEFDVKLYNQSLATNTLIELRTIIRSYFNRLTSVHTPIDAISMDNNIYISHVIQQMESHDNVAWMKFKGWYTNEKNIPNGNYMDANTQSIIQKWKKLEDMPKQELERYTPEMFVLDDDNIVINIIK